jgi:hypothetical protein
MILRAEFRYQELGHFQVGDAARWVSRETAYALYGIGNPNSFEV